MKLSNLVCTNRNYENLKKNHKKIKNSISFGRIFRTFRTESNSDYALNSRVSMYIILKCNLF